MARASLAPRRVKPAPRRAKLRDAVLVRDRGICALCGEDALKMRAAFEAAMAKIASGPFVVFDAVRALRARLAQLGFPAVRNPWWEAHHVVPLAEGGADRLDNVVTLCLPCHSEQTRDLAARLARRRVRRSVRTGWCAGVGRAPRRERRPGQPGRATVCRVCGADAVPDARGRVRPHRAI